MSGIVALKLRILPTGLDVSIKDLENHSKKVLLALGAQNLTFEEEPIAFGLKALLIGCAWPEETSDDEAKNKLSSISGVSSCEIIDYRRAFG
ncbi:MAG: hypothetical protein AABW73_04130 [Nanoarchaeota archaeon]